MHRSCKTSSIPTYLCSWSPFTLPIQPAYPFNWNRGWILLAFEYYPPFLFHDTINLFCSSKVPIPRFVNTH
uniref:Uncharacterized protein n=1 Tax=Rhizophora mucronata TaxID=61149 RepID=A0A2P2KC11_RHIMU